MDKKLDVFEMEYGELASIGTYGNRKFGLRIKTTPATYEEDFKNLVIEVKTTLNNMIQQEKLEKHVGTKR